MKTKKDYKLNFVDVTYRMDCREESKVTERIYYDEIEDIKLIISKNYPYSNLHYKVLIALSNGCKTIYFPTKSDAREFYIELWHKRDNVDSENMILTENSWETITL